MPQIHHSHHPHHINASTIGFGALFVLFLVLAIIINRTQPAHQSLTFLFSFGAAMSALSAWFSSQWDPED